MEKGGREVSILTDESRVCKGKGQRTDSPSPDQPGGHFAARPSPSKTQIAGN